MSFFNFGRKKDNNVTSSDDKVVTDYIADKAVADSGAENAIIAYILLESKKNNISLAYKDGLTYVCFRNEKITKFLKNWFSLIKLYQANRLDQSVYELFVNAQLSDTIPKSQKNESTGLTVEQSAKKKDIKEPNESELQSEDNELEGFLEMFEKMEQ